jgi:hypothetical protein
MHRTRDSSRHAEDQSALSEFIGESGFNRDGICTEPGFPRTLGQVENEKPY